MNMYEMHYRMAQERNVRLNGLLAMTPEQRQEWFDRVDRTIARTDALNAQNWAMYLYLGGEATAANVVVAAKQGRYMDVFNKEVK